MSTETKRTLDTSTARAGLPGTTPDPFWRVRTTADPYSNVHYTDIYSNSAVPTFFTNGTNSVMQTYRNWDGYHRPVGQQRYQAWGGSTFRHDNHKLRMGWNRTYELCNLQFAAVFGILWRYLHAVPHSHIRSSGCLVSTATTGRETITRTWNQNDDVIELSPPPTGENTKKQQIQYDGLGRTSKICYIGNGAATPCGQNTGTSLGLVDTYSYSSPGAGQTQVQIVRTGPQTRTFVFDALGRMISR